MTSCNHSHLTLLPAQNQRKRCRHCHLTINADELGTSYCPECFDVSGKRRYDFDEVEDPDAGRTRYRCEDCGVIIQCA